MENKNKNLNTEAPDPLRGARRTFLRLGLAFFVMTALQYALSYVLSYLASRCFPEFAETEAYYWLSHCTILYLISMPAAWLILRPAPKASAFDKNGGGSRRSLGAYGWFAAVLISLGLMQLGNYAGNLINGMISSLSGHSSYSGLDEMLLSANPAAVFAVVVILGPIAEELVFRKLIIDRISVHGAGVAAVMSALIFALSHGNLQQYFYAFALGLFFSFIYLRTANIKNTVILHMAMNFIGGFVPTMLLRLAGGSEGIAALLEKMAASGTDEGMSEYLSMAYGMYGSLMALSAWSMTVTALGAVGLGMLIAYRRKLTTASCPPAECEIPRARRGDIMFANAGMLLFIAAMAAVLAVSFFG